jgi:hypothetical protein
MLVVFSNNFRKKKCKNEVVIRLSRLPRWSLKKLKKWVTATRGYVIGKQEKSVNYYELLNK